MEEDLGKDEIVLKEKKPRSEAQIKAFEKAREIRLENAKIKKEKIAQVKEEVKNRKVNVTSTDETAKVKTDLINKKIIEPKVAMIEESDEEQVVVVKKKKETKGNLH